MMPGTKGFELFVLDINVVEPPLGALLVCTVNGIQLFDTFLDSSRIRIDR